MYAAAAATVLILVSPTVTFQVTTADETTDSNSKGFLICLVPSVIAVGIVVKVMTRTTETSLSLTPVMLFETAYRKSFFALTELKEELSRPAIVVEAENVMAM